MWTGICLCSCDCRNGTRRDFKPVGFGCSVQIQEKAGLCECIQKGFMRKRVIVKEIVKISIPVSFNRFITSIMSTVEFILIPRMLVLGGMTYQNSIQEYGKLTGMAMPLVFFPSLVTSALATTLVPAISEAMSVKRYKTVNYRMSKSYNLHL